MSTTESAQPLEWSALWLVLESNYNHGVRVWVPTTDAMYDAMLESVPPTIQRWAAFLCGEAWTHNDHGEAVYAAFTKRSGTVEACYLTRSEFRQMIG